MNIMRVKQADGSIVSIPLGSGTSGSGGYYTPSVTDNGNNTITISFTPSSDDMPAVDSVTFNAGDTQTLEEMLQGFEQDPGSVKVYVDSAIGETSGYAATAQQSAVFASTYAQNAEQSRDEARLAAESAKVSEQNAENYEAAAEQSAEVAQNAKNDAQELKNEVEQKLANGDYKGEKGDKGDSGVYVGSGDMPEGYNVQIDPEGEAFNIGDLFGESIPDYWEEHISEKVATIKALQDAGGNDVVNFAWFSDFHYGGDKSYTGNVGVLCAAVMDACDIPLTLMNGDTLTASACRSEELALSLIDTAKEIYAPIGYDRLMLVSGNHDDVYGTSGGVSFVNKIAPEKIWNALYRPQSKDFRRVFGGNGTYFYLDNVPQKVRFVCLNSSYYDGEAITNGTTKAMSIGFGTEQLDWLENTALSVEQGWSVAVASHIPPINEYKSHFTDTTYDRVRSIITAKADCIIAVFCGHMHRSNIYTDELPCPVITVTCAVNTPYDGTTAERVAGTVTETAIDVVSINKATKTINMTRIGHGSDRVVGYGGTVVVTYSVTNTLSNCTNSNSATIIEKGSAYSATITAKSGYVLDSVTVTMGGSAVAVTNGVINIASVTGDIVITATATEEVVEPTYTNLFDKNKALLNARFNSSRTAVTQNGCFVTNVCALPDDYTTNDCYLYLKGIAPTGGESATYDKLLVLYTTEKETLAIGDVADLALQFNLTTNLGVKWETLDDNKKYYKINLKQNATGTIQTPSQNKAFALVFSIGTTALTKDNLPDIIMSFEPIE